MRFIAISFILGIAFHAFNGHPWPGHSWFEDADPHLEAALDIRCGEYLGATRDACETDLNEAFAAGTDAPEPIVRMHCTRWTGTWGHVEERPSRLCEERFGGWLEG